MTNNTHIRYALYKDTFSIRIGRFDYVIDAYHEGISTEKPFVDPELTDEYIPLPELLDVYDSRDEALAALEKKRTVIGYVYLEKEANDGSYLPSGKRFYGTEYFVEEQEADEHGCVITTKMRWFSKLSEDIRKNLESRKAKLKTFNRMFYGVK